MLKSQGPIIVEQDFNCSAAKLWAALVEVDQMKQWFFDNIPDFKAEIGFSTSFPVTNEGRIFTHIWEVTEVIPLQTVTYGWKYAEYPGEAFVRFTLAEMKNQVKLTLYLEVIEDFPQNIPEFARESCIGGWNYFLGQNLFQYLGEK